MHSVSRHEVVACLIPRLRSTPPDHLSSELTHLVSFGSSGERCLAQISLDLLRVSQPAPLLDIVQTLDEPNFQRFLSALSLARKI